AQPHEARSRVPAVGGMRPPACGQSSESKLVRFAPPGVAPHRYAAGPRSAPRGAVWPKPPSYGVLWLGLGVPRRCATRLVSGRLGLKRDPRTNELEVPV